MAFRRLITQYRCIVVLLILVISTGCFATPALCQTIKLTNVRWTGTDKDGLVVSLTFGSRTIYADFDPVMVSSTVQFSGQSRSEDWQKAVKSNKKGTIVAFTEQPATKTDLTFVLTNLDDRGLYVYTRFNDIAARLCKAAGHPVIANDMIVKDVTDNVIRLSGFVPNDTPYRISCTIKVKAVSTGVFKFVSVTLD